MKTISQNDMKGGAPRRQMPSDSAYIRPLHILVLFALFLLLCGTLAALVIHRTGFVVIDIRKPEEQKHLFLPLPVAVLRAGMFFIPEEEKLKIRDTLHPSREAAETFFDEIDSLPDVTFLEVERPGETFRLSKKNGNFVLKVHSPTDQVDVRFPVYAAEQIFRELSR